MTKKNKCFRISSPQLNNIITIPHTITVCGIFLCPFLNVNILLKNDIIFYVLNIRLYNEMIDICADTTLREVDVNADYKEGIRLL